MTSRSPLFYGIYNVAVASDFRRLGLGRILTRQCIQLARERGAGCVHLLVAESNKPAIALYESLGFKPWAEPKVTCEDGVYFSELNLSLVFSKSEAVAY